jgi:hypothetical protein
MVYLRINRVQLMFFNPLSTSLFDIFTNIFDIFKFKETLFTLYC